MTLLGISTVADYGMTWDEYFRFEGGDSKLEYYRELWTGGSPERQNSNYPGLFDLPLALAHDLFPDLGTRSQKGHVWSLCFGLLALVSTWRMSARIGGERAGFWALLFLITMPRFYGHMFFNPKDIPLAGTYAFGCWALVAALGRLPEARWRDALWIGAAAGLAVSCRIAGLLLLVYYGAFVGFFLLYQSIQGRAPINTLPRALATWASRGALAGGVAFAITFVFWPKLHANPFGAVGASVESAQNFGWAGLVLMDHHFWEAQDLPFYYLPYWLFRTLPEPLMLLMVLSACIGSGTVFTKLRAGRFLEPAVWWPRLLVVFAGVFPVGFIIFRDPVLYDGLRHILFVLSPLAALAALTFDWLIRRAGQLEFGWLPRALQGGALVAVALVALEMWRLHPYQYIYFNEISGGLPGAYMRDETDYWGLSHKEAGEWLNAYVAANDPDSGRVYKVHQRYSRWMLQAALDPQRFEMWQPRECADFFVSITRFNLHTSYPEAELIHVVEREGVPLCFVFDLREGTSP